MARTGITTTLLDTALGSVSVNDSIAMLLCPAVAETGTGGLQFALDTAYMITSAKDLTGMGVTEGKNASLLQSVNDFYAKAGSGARLWIVGYAKTADAYEKIPTTFADIVRSTTVSDFALRPRIFAISGDGIEATTTTGQALSPVVTKLVTDMDATLTAMFQDGYRMSGIVDAILINCATAGGILTEQLATTLPAADSFNSPRIAIQLSSIHSTGSASVGDTLGWITTLTLSTSAGAVRLGQEATTAYFLDENAGSAIRTPVALGPTALYDQLGEKQYLFHRTRQDRSGVYFNDAATCNDPTMALSSIEFNRVGNAVCDLVANFFQGLINDTVPTTTSGEVAAAYKDAMLADLRQRYLVPRINAGYCQDIVVDFWAKDGNFIVSRAIEVSVKIFPLATAREVFIEVQFVTSL